MHWTETIPFYLLQEKSSCNYIWSRVQTGLYSAGAGCASFTSLPLLSASSSESSSEAPSMCSWRLPDRLEEKVMGPPLLRTATRQSMKGRGSPTAHGPMLVAALGRPPHWTMGEQFAPSHGANFTHRVLKPLLWPRRRQAVRKHSGILVFLLSAYHHLNFASPKQPKILPLYKHRAQTKS